MPDHIPFSEVRRRLEESVPDPKKREFVLGYLEGQAEHSGSEWQISSSRLKEALDRLGGDHESSAPSFRQVEKGGIAKIQQHFQSRPEH